MFIHYAIITVINSHNKHCCMQKASLALQFRVIGENCSDAVEGMHVFSSRHLIIICAGRVMLTARGLSTK